MGILDTVMNASAAPASARSQATADRPKAKLWLNIGYQAGDKFINLPLGMPIDTMEPVPVTGQNEDWVKQQNARNALLKALQDLGATIPQGEDRDIQLTLKLRRTAEPMAVASGDNEYIADFSKLLG